MWAPPSESEDTRHLNAKQANEITLKQIKNAAKRQSQEDCAAAAAAVAATDNFELENLLQDMDGQEETCNEQQLTPLRTREKGRAIAHAMTGDAELLEATHQDKSVLVMNPTVINVGSTANDGNATVPFERQTKELRSDNMTQYGNTGSQTHSKLDIQKIPEDIQQQQQGSSSTTIIPTSLNATTNTSLGTMMTTTFAAPATATAPAIAQGVGVAVKTVNTGNINSNESNESALPQAQAQAQDSATTLYKGPKFWQYIVRYWATTSQKLALFVIFLLLWALAYCILPDYASPGTGIMRLVFLFVGAELAGILVTHVYLPDMFGMLFFGVLYTNLGFADFSGYQRLEAILRELALINIMLLAGLGLNASAFKKLWFMILRLTVLPTAAEVAIIAVLARYLIAMPWFWGILLGLVITSVSPNVVVTVMLKLKEDRLGLNNGIHTIIYATTTCNDVLGIFAFGVILGVVFSTGSLTQQILQGPVGIGIGIVFGYVYGMLLQYLPSAKSSYMNGLRFVLTILGGCIAVLGSKAIGYPSAGALGCSTLAFIASIGWKRQQCQLALQQQHANENSSVPKRLDLLWKFLKPISFSLIGKEINFSTLDPRVVGYGLVLVFIGSLFRLAFAYASTYGGGLSWRERAYITISGFPKATVQAALGPIALDLARSLNSIDSMQLLFAENVLIVSVLAIIFTAPLGAILMLRLAPIWLQKSDPTVSLDGSTEDLPNDVIIGIGRESKNDEVLTKGFLRFGDESNLSFRSNKSQTTIDVANALCYDTNKRRSSK